MDTVTTPVWHDSKPAHAWISSHQFETMKQRSMVSSVVNYQEIFNKDKVKYNLP